MSRVEGNIFFLDFSQKDSQTALRQRLSEEIMAS